MNFRVNSRSLVFAALSVAIAAALAIAAYLAFTPEGFSRDAWLARREWKRMGFKPIPKPARVTAKCGLDGGPTIVCMVLKYETPQEARSVEAILAADPSLEVERFRGRRTMSWDKISQNFQWFAPFADIEREHTLLTGNGRRLELLTETDSNRVFVFFDGM